MQIVYFDTFEITINRIETEDNKSTEITDPMLPLASQLTLGLVSRRKSAWKGMGLGREVTD